VQKHSYDELLSLPVAVILATSSIGSYNRMSCSLLCRLHSWRGGEICCWHLVVDPINNNWQYCCIILMSHSSLVVGLYVNPRCHGWLLGRGYFFAAVDIICTTLQVQFKEAVYRKTANANIYSAVTSRTDHYESPLDSFGVPTLSEDHRSWSLSTILSKITWTADSLFVYVAGDSECVSCRSQGVIRVNAVVYQYVRSCMPLSIEGLYIHQW